MLTCANVAPVARNIDPDDPRVTAHRMPMEMAGETLQDIITDGDRLMSAVINDAGQLAQESIRDSARAHLESYLDLMAEAAKHSRNLKP